MKKHNSLGLQASKQTNQHTKSRQLQKVPLYVMIQFSLLVDTDCILLPLLLKVLSFVTFV